MHNLYEVQQTAFSVDHHHCRSLPVIVAISQPLLRADFLRVHFILADFKGQHLIDPFDFTSITLHSITAAAPNLDSIASLGDESAKFLADVSDITPHFPTHSQSWCEPLHPY